MVGYLSKKGPFCSISITGSDRNYNLNEKIHFKLQCQSGPVTNQSIYISSQFFTQIKKIKIFNPKKLKKSVLKIIFLFIHP